MLVTIKSPEKYIQESFILKRAGEYIKAFQAKALIIGGKTALNVVKDSFFKSLEDAQIEYVVEGFSGYCTLPSIEHYIKVAEEVGAGIIIGVGGGSVLDVAKYVAETMTYQLSLCLQLLEHVQHGQH